MTHMDMTETTLQFIIKIFSIVVAIVLLAVAGTYVTIVLRDGSDPLVSMAFNDLVNLGQWCVITIGGIIVGKPIASGIGQFFAQKNSPNTNTASLPSSPMNPQETAS